MYFHFSQMNWFQLLLNSPHPNKIALTNGANKANVPIFNWYLEFFK